MAKSKTLIIWEAPARPYKKMDRKFYSSMISLVIVIGVFLAVAGQFMIIIVLLSLLFASYAFYATPPEKTTYAVTEDGVELSGEKIYWEDIESFFVSKRLDGSLINLDLKEGFMKRKYMIPDSSETLTKVVSILQEHLKERERVEKHEKISDILYKLGLKLKTD